MRELMNLLLIFFLPVTTMAEISGTCGDNLIWNYEESTATLIISGSGSMNNYYYVGYSEKYTTAPWGEYRYNIQSLVLDSRITSIGEYAFYGCLFIKEVTIPNNVTTIGRYAFYNCNNLISVIIGMSVTSIGYHAFDETNIKKAIWLTNTPPSGWESVQGIVNYVSNDQYRTGNGFIIYPFLSSMFEVNGIIYVPISPSERTCDAISCVYNNTAENIILSSDVTYKDIRMAVDKIQPYICYNNRFVKNLIVNKEGEIPQYAFFACHYLEKAICNNNDYIANSAFMYCSKMKTVIIGDNRNIDLTNFEGCYIGNNVVEIENNAFRFCNNIYNLVIADRQEELKVGNNGFYPLFGDCPLDSVYIGGNISYNTDAHSGYSPFARNATLRAVFLSDKETEISANEFYGCTNLKNVYIGDGVTTIGDWAFSGCSSLDFFIFGSNVRNIGKEAFSDCMAVTRIISHAQTPPICGTQALDDINKWNCKLIVPEGYLAAYKTAEQWKDFFFIEEEIIDNIKTPHTRNSQSTNDVNIYDTSGRKRNKIGPGVNVLLMKNGKRQKVLLK